MNTSQKIRRAKIRKIDHGRQRSLEENPDLSYKTECFYFSKKSPTKSIPPGTENTMNIMEMVHKSNNLDVTPQGGASNMNLSNWTSALKTKKQNSKAEILAKLALLRGHSADRGKRRQLHLKMSLHHPFF